MKTNYERREMRETDAVSHCPRAHSRPPFAHFVVPLSLVLIAATVAFAGASDFNPTNATLDELFATAQRYGNTPERRQNKESARAELLARKAESLKYLLQGVHTENMWYGIYADQVMDGMATNDIATVLLPFLKSEHKETRRLTVYFLGLRRTPEHAPLILPFLDDEEASGPAIRTLGKWQVTNAVDRITTFLGDTKERKRVLAANALGDIRDPRAVTALIRALADPVFTVRRASARALAALGPAAEKELLDSLKITQATQRREIIQTLGAMRSKEAIPSLRALLNNPDQGTRTDAAIALTAIAPKESPDWIKGTEAEGLLTAAGMVSNE